MLTVTKLSSTILSSISFTLEKNEVVCISGPSGSGKTQLLRAIADMDVNDAEIFLNQRSRDEFTAPEWRQQVAYLPSDSRWWGRYVNDHFSVLPDALSSRLGFDKSVGQWEVERLSSGEKQRLALLRVLANKPRVLLLDEPSANLDAENIVAMENLLQAYIEDYDAMILWVTHSQEQIQRIANRVFTMTAGQLQAKQAAT